MSVHIFTLLGHPFVRSVGVLDVVLVDSRGFGEDVEERTRNKHADVVLGTFVLKVQFLHKFTHDGVNGRQHSTDGDGFVNQLGVHLCLGVGFHEDGT